MHQQDTSSSKDAVVYVSDFCIPSLLHLSNMWFSVLDFMFVSLVILHLVPSNDIVLKIHIFAGIYTYWLLLLFFTLHTLALLLV